MDPRTNPFTPGAGTPPPELAGRDEILSNAEIALHRVKNGRPARGQLMLGLRGVGKTVLLNRIAVQAEELGCSTIVLEAPEGKRLAENLVPPLRSLLSRLSRSERARAKATRALSLLRSFAATFRIYVADVEFGVAPATGEADSGILENDLLEVFLALGQAARAEDEPVALLIDEVQYLRIDDLSALISSMHKIAQQNLPIILFGAGLPQLAALAGEAKSYAERLFEYPEVGALSREAAREAIRVPIEREGAAIADEALERIVETTRGYPYFLQEWGSHSWDCAPESPIGVQDVRRATVSALSCLDKSFFRVRFDRLTPREKDYMLAMAELGPGPHRSGEIAQKLRLDVRSAGPLRDKLIKKGMIFSPQHGDTAFTVPMFDEFMLRAMPDGAATDSPPGGEG